MVKFWLNYLKNMKLNAALYILASILLWSIELILPYMTGNFIDHIVNEVASQIFVYYVVLITLLSFIRLGIQYLKTISYVKLSNRMQFKICNDLLQRMYTSKFSHYCNIDTANYADRISKDGSVFTQFFCSNMCSFCLQIMSIVVCSTIVSRSDTLLALIILALVPIYALTYSLNKDKMYEARKNYKTQSNVYFSKLFEQIDKYKFVRRNALNKEMEERLQSSFGNYQKSTSHCISVEFFFSNLNLFFIITAYSLILVLGGYKVSTGQLSIGSFTVINTYFNQIIQAVSYYLGFASKFQDAKTSYDRIMAIHECESELNGTYKLDKLEVIQVYDLSISHNNAVILSPKTIEFHRGNIYGIKGINGSGKTTFLNSLMGLYPAERMGTISYNGLELSQINLSSFRKNSISYLEQEPTLMNMAIKDFLQFGIDLDNRTLDRQRSLIQKFSIEESINIDKEMNGDGSNLSGGERQKLSLIRILSKESDLYLLDEPTSALDKTSIEVLFSILSEKKHHAIIIMISHDENVLNHCDHIIEF